jgi:hypothetical protein
VVTAEAAVNWAELKDRRRFGQATRVHRCVLLNFWFGCKVPCHRLFTSMTTRCSLGFRFSFVPLTKRRHRSTADRSALGKRIAPS